MKGEQIEDLSKLTFPLWASPKIDGFRCILGQQPYTSRLSPFPNEHFRKELSGVLPARSFLDAEAVVGGRRGSGVLQRTSSGLTSKDGQPDFTLWVFDRPGLEFGWYGRYAEAARLIRSVGHPRIKLLKHTLIASLPDLEEFIEDKLAAGYEGVMVRSQDGHYKQGKGTIREQLLLKVKPFVDAEGEVTGFFEEEENLNPEKRDNTGKLKRSSSKEGKRAKGTLGGFILRDLKTSVEVRVGGGFTKDQRKTYWQHREEMIGKIVKYKSQQVGVKDKPRHPTFVCFREAWDL